MNKEPAAGKALKDFSDISQANKAYILDELAAKYSPQEISYILGCFEHAHDRKIEDNKKIALKALGLPPRIYTRLVAGLGAKNVGDILKYSENDIAEEYYVGLGAIRTLKEKLRNLGLELKVKKL